jgi:CelD/BcsL family acetyltransferase involved in cellulose biosynthesis
MEMDGLSWSLTPLTNIAKLQTLWTELETRSDCAFFLTWDWIGTWLSTTPDLSPLLLSVYDSSRVVALALFQPARIQRRAHANRALLLHRSGKPSEDLVTIEYNGILVDRLYTRRVESCIFLFLKEAQISSGDSPRWQEIHVGLAANSVAERARAAKLVVVETSRQPSWFVDLAAIRTDGKQYLDTLSANTRYQIRRAIGMYQKFGPINARAAASVDEALHFFEELKTLHQMTWTQRGLPGSFSSSHFEDFHRTLLGRCIERGCAEIVRVTAGSHLIGQLYNFIRNGHVYAYQTGFSYEGDPKLKPGLVGHSMCLERHIRNGDLIYDFMAGGARYKSNLGIRGPDMTYYIFQRNTLTSRSLAFGRRIKNSFQKATTFRT